MEKRYKKIKIENIPSVSFQGYYWMSDSSKPVVQYQGEIDKSVFTSLPFAVEANYYSKDLEISIQVKNIDGVYDVAQIDVKDCDAKKYIGHDVDADYLIVEAWQNVEDELLEGMMTKVPSWTAFKGFVKSSKRKKND